MTIRRCLLLVFAAFFASCSAAPPRLTRTGTLSGGATIVVQNENGDINAYAPARGAPQDRYTIDAYGAQPNDVDITKVGLVLRATARKPGVRFLVRAPRGTTLNLSAGVGNVSVADYDGIVNVQTGHGDVRLLIPQYGNVAVGRGSLDVVFASDSWPGTLHLRVGSGSAVVYVNEHARARIRMHTDDGTVFSDFPITGTSSGRSETIDAPINGGGPRAIDIEVKHGDVRVLQLKPQI